MLRLSDIGFKKGSTRIQEGFYKQVLEDFRFSEVGFGIR